MFRSQRAWAFAAILMLSFTGIGCDDDDDDNIIVVDDDPFFPIINHFGIVELDVRVLLFDPQGRPIIRDVELTVDGSILNRQTLFVGVHTIELVGQRNVARGQHTIGIRVFSLGMNGQNVNSASLNFVVTVFARLRLCFNDDIDLTDCELTNRIQQITIGGTTTPRNQVFTISEILRIPILVDP
ncbi:MAG: hypothetical protein ACREMQ_15300 [Longimicrobiales bacterium]